MPSPREKQTVASILDSALGSGVVLKTDEHVYYCPFCHHHKRKMNVNVETQKYHCWTCNAKGRSIESLLHRLNVDQRDLQRVRDIYGDTNAAYDRTDEIIKLLLPKEFRKLAFKQKTIDPLYNQAIYYLKCRGILIADIIKYNIGYCESGLYKNRIIVPSYDANGELNYFVARAIFEGDMKYKNPPISRDVIVFENQINWNAPIVLVEGAYDAFSVKRNVIPLLGKYILSNLKAKLVEKGVKDITIMLDNDAVSDSTKHTAFFLRNGIRVRNIIPTNDQDAGELGFAAVTQLIKDAPETQWDDLIKTKLQNL